MSYYVELLRAKRALIIAGVILGIFLVTTIIIRLSIHGTSVRDWPLQLGASPTAHVTKTTLADGSIKSVVDDPFKHIHATIVQGANNTFSFDITEPNDNPSREDHMSFGSASMNETTFAHGTMRRVTGTFKPDDLKLGIGWIFMGTIPMGLIIATILGGALAKENDGHLELTWTRPFSREHSAVSAIAVDVAAITASQILTIIAVFLAALMFVVPRVDATSASAWQIGVAIFAPLAWYALLNAASSSLKRGPGIVCGLGWMAAIVIPSVAGILEAPAQGNSVAAVFYSIFHALSYLDPISYLSFRDRHGVMTTAMGLSLETAAGLMLLLTIVYLALSVLQWRRVEA